MKTRYIKNLSKRFSTLVSSIFVLMSAFSQIDAPGLSVWQWSTTVRGGYTNTGTPKAYLWIPENCTKLRGLVVAENNMEELSILENQQFRDSLKSIGFGEIWFSPAFSPFFNMQEGAGVLFDNTLSDLATQSGYPELYFVPCVGIGHSAMANFGFELMTTFPSRALCGVSISAVFPYDYGNDYARPNNCGSNIDYQPYLVCQGEMEGAGDLANSIFAKSFYKRLNHPLTPITYLSCAGEWHFATSQKKTNFIAYYIKNAAYYRIGADATGSSFAALNPINPTTTGWLYDRWIKNMRPRYATAPVATYAGTQSKTGSAGEQNYWAFDEAMARRIEAYENSYFRKTPCLIAYNQSSTAGVVGGQVAQNNNHVQCRLQFYPLNDSLDFELSSSFLDTIPAVSGRCVNFMNTTTDTIAGKITPGIVGTHIGHPSTNINSVIDREIGSVAKIRKNEVTGITTFRLQMERGSGNSNTIFNPIFSVADPGDATYKASVLQADMWINMYNTSGISQTITFPQIANVANTTKTVTLNATSSVGLPVQYWVEEGPAKIVGNKIVFTAIPQNAILPMKVTVVAWQWGRNSDMVNRLGGSLYQTANPVSNTFYITGRLTPILDMTFSGTKISTTLNRINWNTFTQVNNANYVIEHSVDNKNWTDIQAVAANSSVQTYSYEDSNPVNSFNYYRLRVVSADGTIAYSETVSINNGLTSTPAIASKEIYIKKVQNTIQTIGFTINSKVMITISDLSGKIVSHSNEIVPSNGIIVNQLFVSAPGVYFVNACSETETKTLKFIF